MFSLLYGLWQYMFRRDEYFVLILGLDNAGKTTFLQTTQMQFNKNYKGMPLDKITTTVGLNIGKIDTGPIRLMFWDLGGQEELQALWDKYYAESHGVIYVVDSADKERLEESRRAFDEMLSSEALHGVPLLVLANKQDLQDVLHVSDIKAEFNKSSSSIGRRDCHIQPVSALTGQGVNEGIDWLVECVKRNTYQRPPHAKEIS
ncbi:ADP-ribosylation factor-related protein 1-like [Patiria miniata]|uniref:ADP-ribosylation factor-related protein 1 n=1 Tax=Patiria miniata TaxID=46514 RepID=A0A913ZYZ1_PATMI|nr:ADP-ribosylation factor-related protein 1-like [Patiria miniata]XP_038056695.1 ADP-ribosylation factor-related protein 1-like [Patiria miniata]